MQKSVALAGATGLTGSRLLELLLQDISVREVLVLSRRQPDTEHPKLRWRKTSFDQEEDLVEVLRNFDTLYCAIGSTIRKAGSMEAFRAVDYGIPLFLAQIAEKAGIRSLIIISSIGADPESRNFYLRTKGEMERDIKARFHFRKLAFVQPSLLIGPREEFRLTERIGQFFMVSFSFLLRGRLKKYRPILDVTLAKAMIHISGSLNNQTVYGSEELQWLGR